VRRLAGLRPERPRQHLLDRVTRNEMDQKEDHRHHEPDHRQRVQRAGEKGSETQSSVVSLQSSARQDRFPKSFSIQGEPREDKGRMLKVWFADHGRLKTANCSHPACCIALACLLSIFTLAMR